MTVHAYAFANNDQVAALGFLIIAIAVYGPFALWVAFDTGRIRMPQKRPKGTTRPSPLDARDVCPHTNREPVELLDGGERVAQLCLDCDAQLDPGYADHQRTFFLNSASASSGAPA